MAKRDKKAAFAGKAPQPTKEASATADPHAYRNQKPFWSFRHLDRDGGTWSWDKLEKHSPNVHARLREYEAKTWSELEAMQSRGNRMNGHMEIDKISSEAQERLAELGLDQFDTLFKFRITQTGRVWGIRIENICCIVWWDPEHTVYPMNVADN